MAKKLDPFRNLSFLTTPGLERIDESTMYQDKPISPALPANVNIVENVLNPAILVHFSIRIPVEKLDRLYSEVFHDPARRPLYQVVGEILDRGLEGRPYKGPADPGFVKQLKAKGKRGKKA